MAFAVMLPPLDVGMMKVAAAIVWLVVIMLARAYYVASRRGSAVLAVVPWPDPRRPYRFVIIEFNEG